MKSIFLLLALTLTTSLCYANDVPKRKVITAPKPQAKELPRGFGVPIQRPQGFGKQQWQQPQPRPQQPKVETRHSFGWYNYYRPVNPYFRYYRVPAYQPSSNSSLVIRPKKSFCSASISVPPNNSTQQS